MLLKLEEIIKIVYHVLFPYQVFVDIIFAYFSASDPESDVTSYEVAWGTAPGLTDVKDFEEVTNTTIWLAKFKDNALEVGKKYYATVRATNGAGLLSDRLSSNGIVVGKSEYTFDNKSSAEFFFDTVNVNENGSRKDGGVGKTYGTLTVPEGAVKGEVKLRSYSLDEKTMDQNKTEEGPVSNPKFTKPKVCVSPSIRSFIPPFSLYSLMELPINIMDCLHNFYNSLLWPPACHGNWSPSQLLAVRFVM